MDIIKCCYFFLFTSLLFSGKCVYAADKKERKERDELLYAIRDYSPERVKKALKKGSGLTDGAAHAYLEQMEESRTRLGVDSGADFDEENEALAGMQEKMGKISHYLELRYLAQRTPPPGVERDTWVAFKGAVSSSSRSKEGKSKEPKQSLYQQVKQRFGRKKRTSEKPEEE